MKDLIKTNKIKSNKDNKNNQAHHQAYNSACLKDWTKEFQSHKLKSALDAGFSKSVRNSRKARNFRKLNNSILGRSSSDKKLDVFFDNLITIEELADYIGISQKTIRNWICLRRIPFLRVGKRTFFRFERIKVWLKTKEFEPCQ